MKFLAKHSKYGKNIKEIELAAETLSSKLYIIVGAEDEIAIKIPKHYNDQTEAKLGFLDLIF